MLNGRRTFSLDFLNLLRRPCEAYLVFLLFLLSNFQPRLAFLFLLPPPASPARLSESASPGGACASKLRWEVDASFASRVLGVLRFGTRVGEGEG